MHSRHALRLTPIPQTVRALVKVPAASPARQGVAGPGSPVPDQAAHKGQAAGVGMCSSVGAGVASGRPTSDLTGLDLSASNLASSTTADRDPGLSHAAATVVDHFSIHDLPGQAMAEAVKRLCAADLCAGCHEAVHSRNMRDVRAELARPGFSIPEVVACCCKASGLRELRVFGPRK